MVADTYTTRLGLIVPGTGNDNNSWGDIFNASFGAIIERAVAGIVTHTDTGGTLDLSASPPPAGPSGAIDYVHKFTGALASNLTVQMPNVQKTWLIDNSTSGAFQLFIRNGAAGSVVQIPQGCVRLVVCDAAGGMKREDADAVGTFRYSGSATLQAGGLDCNGASKLRTDYPDLFARIGTTWGSVDGTHFTLPNLQDTGRFLRSSSGSLTVGTYQANQNLSHTHTFSGALTAGSLVTDSQGAHQHSVFLKDPGHIHSTNAAVVTSGLAFGSNSGAATGGAAVNSNTTGMTIGSVNGVANDNLTASAGAHTHTVTGVPGLGTLATVASGGTEARPEAAVAYVSILY
jgi:microcystin-dependent protein